MQDIYAALDNVCNTCTMTQIQRPDLQMWAELHIPIGKDLVILINHDKKSVINHSKTTVEVQKNISARVDEHVFEYSFTGLDKVLMSITRIEQDGTNNDMIYNIFADRVQSYIYNKPDAETSGMVAKIVDAVQMFIKAWNKVHVHTAGAHDTGITYKRQENVVETVHGKRRVYTKPKGKVWFVKVNGKFVEYTKVKV